ncbi:ureidoglycolate lyase [Gemmobacter lanyuensis]|uniref:Ureidoglycolate lyase n=1 Tax=Gemmobacter lanyuensis TaxID=1054497 RepID=A0A918ISV9_9RHOB|nr:ureidoglycolate lyase [Gemmobacter lanyuensis]GGW31015.1 ureidoglycolate lyase [Gemmobacter lanyuensis]
MRVIHTEPLTPESFAPFGDVMAATGAPDRLINQGFCGRYHDRAQLDFGPDGRAGLSIFKAIPRSFPYLLDLVERHPEGSQAFIPMTADPFLVITAPDQDGTPGTPRAFLTDGSQAINFHRGTWHGVLTPLAAPGLFAVVDRIGPTANLQEHWFDQPWTITPA